MNFGLPPPPLHALSTSLMFWYILCYTPLEQRVLTVKTRKLPKMMLPCINLKSDYYPKFIFTLIAFDRQNSHLQGSCYKKWYISLWLPSVANYCCQQFEFSWNYNKMGIGNWTVHWLRRKKWHLPENLNQRTWDPPPNISPVSSNACYLEISSEIKGNQEVCFQKY